MSFADAAAKKKAGAPPGPARAGYSQAKIPIPEPAKAASSLPAAAKSDTKTSNEEVTHPRVDELEAKVQQGITRLQGLNCELQAGQAIMAELPPGKSGMMFEEYKERSEKIVKETDAVLKDWTAATQGGQQKQIFQRNMLSQTYDFEKKLCQQRMKEVWDAKEAWKNPEAKGPELPEGIHSGMSLPQLSPEETSANSAANKAKLAKENEEGVKRITNAVGEVKQLFRDLGAIAADQRKDLETLEDNAESAKNNLQGATKEIQIADDRDRKSGWRGWLGWY